jgi:hypothetical protein
MSFAIVNGLASDRGRLFGGEIQSGERIERWVSERVDRRRRCDHATPGRALRQELPSPSSIGADPTLRRMLR